MTRIQRGQEADTRWTVQLPHAFCRAELAEPLSADSARTPALRPEINLPSANSVFLFSHSSFVEVIKLLIDSPLPGWTIFIGFDSLCFVLGEGEPEAR